VQIVFAFLNFFLNLDGWGQEKKAEYGLVLQVSPIFIPLGRTSSDFANAPLYSYELKNSVGQRLVLGLQRSKNNWAIGLGMACYRMSQRFQMNVDILKPNASIPQLSSSIDKLFFAINGEVSLSSKHARTNLNSFSALDFTAHSGKTKHLSSSSKPRVPLAQGHAHSSGMNVFLKLEGHGLTLILAFSSFTNVPLQRCKTKGCDQCCHHSCNNFFRLPNQDGRCHFGI